MTFPSFVFGFVISTLLGVAFHVWKGGSLIRLGFYVILAWAGFWIGHWIGDRYGWTFASLSTLHLGMAVLTSLVFLTAGYWLSLVEIDRN